MGHVEQLCGLKFLIVEDDEPTRERLSEELTTKMPQSTVVTASTVNDGKRRIREAAQKPFDVAVLDFKLPQQSLGDEPEVSFELTQDLTVFSPNTVLVHVTAHGQDSAIQNFIKKDELVERGQIFICKHDTAEESWIDMVIESICSCLHRRRIREKYRQLFPNNLHYGPFRFFGAMIKGSSDRGRSLAIADLCDDGQKHWDLLDENLQNMLKSSLGYFKSENERHILGGIHISDFRLEEGR